ncbi:MAG: type II toxin-antitoxin system RelE/ParE family toxin [Clostridiales bacterium]|nr:type II toxin-antitoxin system RelE/ParE family toxin [Clostridiales bacterium]
MDNFDIDFFRLDNGVSPVEEYLNASDTKMRAKILWTIGLLEKNGNTLAMPYSEHLQDGIFELRAKQGSDISRVLYFFCIGRNIILTHGFTKKTKKVPKNEIETAKKYREIYLSRQKGE